MAFKGCKGLADADGMIIVRGILFGYLASSGNVVVPEGVTRIDNLVFSDRYKDLVQIALPKSLKTIGRAAFECCPKLTIYAPAGSYAEKHAKKAKSPSRRYKPQNEVCTD